MKKCKHFQDPTTETTKALSKIWLSHRKCSSPFCALTTVISFLLPQLYVPLGLSQDHSHSIYQDPSCTVTSLQWICSNHIKNFFHSLDSSVTISNSPKNTYSLSYYVSIWSPIHINILILRHAHWGKMLQSLICHEIFQDISNQEDQQWREPRSCLGKLRFNLGKHSPSPKKSYPPFWAICW